ncbi:3-dehydroshikimate dehydratase [Aspergillus piperis CBS 112811]|uniref:3-dehydroshikimate dehydratase n=1 Tax=Aspergillus piperis CBS 112811 TaxID=1448313 RepID=A0A8G1VLM5_9EURO|nr:3-dehydroshikimate dehydratase [Aspergillus piperis CBS 112811]RAH57964.1 3-dehydroshikimate dehydratase [Aspergillus piperis CBS 112811]
MSATTTSDPRRYAYLVGIGVTHSIAPPMHTYAFNSMGYPWTFIAQECPTVEDAMTLFRQPTFAGGVVTMPYKRTIMEHLDGLDEYAVRLQACNNVYRAEDGTLRGTNTDWRGIKGCLLSADPEEKGRGKAAVIVGAGGACRAAVYALYAELGCTPIYVVNRDEEEVRVLREDTEKEYGEGLKMVHVERMEQVAGLLENAAPGYIVGTVPDAEPVTAEEKEVHRIVEAFLDAPTKGVLLDMCFKPRQTRFLKMARQRGKHINLSQIAQAGFQGVEIFYEDLEYLAKEKGQPTEENLLAAARETKNICNHHGLEVIGLQPFMFYEGLLDRDVHQQKIAKLHTWFKIIKILGTDIIQIPSNFQPDGISGDLDLIVSDMIEVADLGLKQEPPVRFAYESLAWGTYVSTWDTMWEIIQRVDRPNFGCCLDTFNIAGRVWADPASPSGKVPDADAVLAHSLDHLVKTIDVKKVFYVQVVDAEKMEQPLVPGHPFHVDGQPARMNWSRNARLFLYEQDKGGYLPVVEVARVILKELGFEGWVSMELFSRTMADPDPSVPQSHSQRGIRAWQQLAKELDL